MRNIAEYFKKITFTTFSVYVLVLSSVAYAQDEEVCKQNFYFFQQNDFVLEKEHASYRNIYLLYNEYNTFFGEHFQLQSLGLLHPFGFMVGLNPRCSFSGRSAQERWGFGSYLIASIEAGNNYHRFGSYWLPYCSYTYGILDKNINVKLMWGYGDFISGSEKSSPLILSINGMLPITKRIGLLTENYQSYPFYTGVVNLTGIRYVFKKTSLSIGLGTLISSKDGYKGSFPLFTYQHVFSKS